MRTISTGFFGIGFFILGLFAGTKSLMAQEVSLKPLFDQYGMTVRDQGGRGTCSVFAVVGLMEFEYAHRHGQIEASQSIS
jgi:hypothetical protein